MTNAQLVTNAPQSLVDLETVPRHVAFIMDGNRRWAKERGLPSAIGHHSGLQNAMKVVRACKEYGVEYVTLYAFSIENWNRKKTEVQFLMGLLRQFFTNTIKDLIVEDVRVVVIGKKELLPSGIRTLVEKAEEDTKHGKSLTLTLAFSYGSRDEIATAVKDIVQDNHSVDAITPELINSYLFTSGQPDPDLLVRTGREKRLSNFLLWQLSYTELYFSDALWPDFDEEQLRLALAEFSHRKRRFGR